MKNILRTQIDLFGTPVIVCLGAKAFKRVIKKEHGVKDGTEILDSAGKYVALEHPDYPLTLVIGIDSTQDLLGVERTLVHELSHAVTQIMEYFGVVCDETRSYMLDYLYGASIEWLRKVAK